MRKLYSENQVKQIVIDVLKDLGIELEEDTGKLEFNVPVVFDENIKIDDSAELHMPSGVYFSDDGLLTFMDAASLTEGNTVAVKIYE